MEPSRGPLRTVRLSWQGLVLAASLLTFWNEPTTAQLTIEAVPPNVAEGQDILLRALNLGENLYGYKWFKGKCVVENCLIIRYVIASNETNKGIEYRGRETAYHNGSLLIQNVTLNDAGVYTFQTVNSNLGLESVSVKFRVYVQLSKPYIRSNVSKPVEGEDSVALTCEPQSENITYRWRVKGQNLPDDARLELSSDHRTVILLSVTRNDTGPYECEIGNPVSTSRSDPYTLDVVYGPDAPTISPSESYFQAGANLNLSCQAASNPPSQYSWFINGISQPPSSELFIPNITTNDSGIYSCFANNSFTGLNRTTVKNITVFEPVTPPSIQATNITSTEEDAVVFTCLSAHSGLSIRWLFKHENLRLTDRMKLSENNSVLIIDPVRREDAGEYQCEVSNPVSASKSDTLRLAVISSEDPSGLPVGTVVGIVTGVLACLALVATLCYLLFLTRTSRSSIRDDLREPQSPGGGHLGRSVSKAPIAGLRSDVPVYEELVKPDVNIYDRIIHTTDVASSCPPGSAA